MLDCKMARGPCSLRPVEQPPCPPPPPYKFPWMYPIIVSAVVSVIGLFYKWYLWYDAKKHNVAEQPIWRPRPRLKRPVHEDDLPECVQYLIVGGGAAGWSAYRSIAQHDPKAKVFFLTKEDVYPYRRPPMSKCMWWNNEPPDLSQLNYVEDQKRSSMYYAECKKFMDPVMFYRKKTGPALSIGVGWCVLRVDADDHVVWIKTLCGERPMYYERCLLAVGSKAKNLSIFKNASNFVRERVCALRTLRDLEIAYRKVREAKHVTVIGAGPMGCELAYHLSRMHEEWFPPPDPDYVPPKILHVYKDKGILSGIIPEYLGEWGGEKLKCRNVVIMPKTCVYDAFKSEDGRLQLTLSNGKSVVTDFVLVAIGSTPRTELADESYLELDPIHGGFKVNAEFQIRRHLYMAGDSVTFFSQWKNYCMRLEYELSAREQGFIAGANMAGYWIPANFEPHFWMTCGEDIRLEVVGEAGACMPTIGLFYPCDKDLIGTAYEKRIGELDRPCYKQSEEYRNKYRRGMLFYMRDDIVVGMAFWNFPPIPDRKDVVTEMLRSKPTYKDINALAEQLGFKDIQCVYVPPELVKKVGTCLSQNASKWMKYEDHEHELAKVVKPETVLYVNQPLGIKPPPDMGDIVTPK